MSYKLIAVALATLFTTPALAENHESHESHHHGDYQSPVAAFVNHWSVDNATFIAAHNAEYFALLSKGQSPKATVVTCSDSRVQTDEFDRAPEGELFMVRDIGNQMSTAEGSVEYGVHHLHTPILVFLGHSRCGAIAAASGDYSKESVSIKRELDSINIKKGAENIDGVLVNVNNQVAAAQKKFAEEVKEGHLTIIGAVFDFADDMKKGAGKINVININGVTDPTKLQAALNSAHAH